MGDTLPNSRPAAKHPAAAEARKDDASYEVGSIQPHGAVVVLDQNLQVLQASANAGYWLQVKDAPSHPERLVDALHAASLTPFLEDWQQGGRPAMQERVAFGDHFLEVALHPTHQGMLLEFEESGPLAAERAQDLYARIRQFGGQLANLDEPARMAAAAASQIRALTGFNRVVVYAFDGFGTASVVAEDGDGALSSYLDLRFPPSTVLLGAPEDQHLQPMLFVPDADFEPVPLVPSRNPLDGQPLDLRLCSLRALTEDQRRHLRSLGAAASMTLAILIDGMPWGAIACHHRLPRWISPGMRAGCQLLVEFLALRLGGRSRSAYSARRGASKKTQIELIAHLSSAPTFEAGWHENAAGLLELVGASGAAVRGKEFACTAGAVPDTEQIDALVEWLKTKRVEPYFATDCLSRDYPPAGAYADVASGLLAVSVSQLHPHFVLWFRREARHTVFWGDDPRPSAAPSVGAAQFSPWEEDVRARAAPWTQADIDAVCDFRHALVNLVLRHAEERAALTEKLERANSELESFSYSVSHDLRAPFRHIAGYTQLLRAHAPSLDQKCQHYLESIAEAALAAGQLVDDLLSFSHLGRTRLSLLTVDMNKLVDEVLRSMEPELKNRNIVWRIDPLPPARGDPSLLRQVFANLIGNAVKYTRNHDPAEIAIRSEDLAEETVYSVRDNGVGFDMRYVHKLFGVFQRLHRMEDFEGTGIGLALVRRIVDRHHGWIRAEGAVGEGACFTFALPKKDGEEHG